MITKNDEINGAFLRPLGLGKLVPDISPQKTEAQPSEASNLERSPNVDEFKKHK